MSTFTWSTTAGALLLTASVTLAQDTATPARIELVAVTVIPSDANGVTIRRYASIARSDNGFVLSPTYDGNVALWSNGRLREIGRQGGGPNEFLSNLHNAITATTSGAAVVVHANRLSVLNPTTAAIARQLNLNTSGNYIVAAGRSFLLSGSKTGGDIMVFDSAGRRTRTIKSPIGRKWMDVLSIWPSGDTAFWVNTLYTYRADLLTLDGRTLRSVARSPAWFRSEGYVPGEGSNKPPNPKLHGVREIGPFLMFLVHVADSEWRPGPLRGSTLENLRPDQIFDTILEVVDPRTGALLATRRLDNFVRYVHGSDLVWFLQENSYGEPSFHIMRIEIVSR